MDQFLETFPVAHKETAHRQLGIIDDAIVPSSVMGSGSLDEIITAFGDLAGQDVSKWTRTASQSLIDERQPEHNWITGVYETIQQLRVKGYKIGIVTSDTKRNTSVLEETNSSELFDLVISTETHAAENQTQKC